MRFDDDFLAETDELYNREEEEKLQEEKEKKQQEQKKLMQEKQQGEENNEATPAKQQNDPVSPAPQTLAPQEPLQNKLQLDPSLAQGLLRYITDTLFPPVVKQEKEQKIPLALKYLAARVLFKLSVVSFDAVFQKVELFFKGMKSDEYVYTVSYD